MRKPFRLFVDANVWIAAAGSKTGGSATVLELCRRGKGQAVTSRLVLLEAERNIRTKLGRNASLRFYQEIASLDVKLVQAAVEREISAQERIIDSKDAHVLAAAIKGNVDFLLTWDRKHFMSPKVLEAKLTFRIMTPGGFLRYWLQQLL